MEADITKRLTKSEKRIHDFIETSTDEFLFMTIGQASDKLKISEATISRYARHMGYQDFKELKSAVLKKKSGRGAARKLAGTLMKDQGFHMENWLDFQKKCLEKTWEHLDMEAFLQGKEALRNAGRILIHGKNASAALGELLFFRLRRLGLPVMQIPSGGSEVLEGLVHASKGDLVIFFAFSKISREAKVILDYARTTGCRTLAFTGRTYIPQEERADINLYVYRGEEDEYHSMTSAAAMIDGLVIALTEDLGQLGTERLICLQKLKKQYQEK